MNQDQGEPVRSFAAKIKGKAATCAFHVTCSKTGCNTEVDFTDTISKYVLVNGLADKEIKRETLGWANLDTSHHC